MQNMTGFSFWQPGLNLVAIPQSLPKKPGFFRFDHFRAISSSDGLLMTTSVPQE
jgi:hypothetical protein